MTSFVSVDLHARTTGPSLYRSILIKMYSSPLTCFPCGLSEKLICRSCPGWISTGSLVFLVVGNRYFIFLPELTHAVHVLLLSPLHILISDLQNLLISARFFLEPSCPKCSASTICFFSSWWTKVFPPKNRQPKRSLSSLNTGENSLGACSFWLLSIFNCSSFLCVNRGYVFKSTIYLSSEFFEFSYASAFFIFSSLSHDLLGYNVSSFLQNHKFSKQRYECYLLASAHHFCQYSTHVRALFKFSPCLCLPSVHWIQSIFHPSVLPVVSKNQFEVDWCYFVSPAVVHSSRHPHFSV